MKIESLVANVTSSGSLVGAESAVLWDILIFVGRFGPLLWPVRRFMICGYLLNCNVNSVVDY